MLPILEIRGLNKTTFQTFKGFPPLNPFPQKHVRSTLDIVMGIVEKMLNYSVKNCFYFKIYFSHTDKIKI